MKFSAEFSLFFFPRASFSISCELSPMEKILHDVSVPVFLRDGDFIHVLPAEPAQRVVKVNYHCVWRLLFLTVRYILTSACGYIWFKARRLYCMS